MKIDLVEIDGKIISSDLKHKHFICDLNVCKGACCVAGDNGAPLEQEELEILDQVVEKVKPYLTQEGITTIEKNGAYQYDSKEKTYHTSLINGKACSFINYENGIAVCGIEKAYNEGKIDFKKPISCHLYPIRVSKLGDFEALNYEKWEICAAACVKGAKEKVAVYQFLKEPLIRKYGKSFYKTLEAAFNRNA